MQRVRSEHSERCRWRVGAFGLILVGLLSTTVQGAELALLLNQDTFTAGDTLTLSGIADPQGELVDVYIGLVLPTGDLVFLTPAGGLTLTPQTLTPEGLAEAASAEIFRYTLMGTEPAGSYSWLGVLTAHGTTNFVSEIAQAPFIVEEAMAGSQ
ncbi:MAG: hypothetical protein M3361_12350 [Candidatus Tectomicrobia bacterium]|nr:hypothetical protein [Candidatus Tectomicrobia bacterium]